MNNNHITLSSRGTNFILSLSNSFFNSSLLISVPETNGQATLGTHVILLLVVLKTEILFSGSLTSFVMVYTSPIIYQFPPLYCTLCCVQTSFFFYLGTTYKLVYV